MDNKALHDETVYDRGAKYPSEDEQRTIFVASCIESVAERLHCNPAEIYKRMQAARLIQEYILKHYDVIHTESRENITDDMIDMLRRREEKGGEAHA